MYMSQAVVIRLRDGVSERLKEAFGCTSNTGVAKIIGVDQGHYSRVLNGRSDPGPYFQARLLLCVKSKGLAFEDLFEVAKAPERKSA